MNLKIQTHSIVQTLRFTVEGEDILPLRTPGHPGETFRPRRGEATFSGSTFRAIELIGPKVNATGRASDRVVRSAYFTRNDIYGGDSPAWLVGVVDRLVISVAVNS